MREEVACAMKNECRRSKDQAERRANTEATDEEQKLADSVDNECEQKLRRNVSYGSLGCDRSTAEQ